MALPHFYLSDQILSHEEEACFTLALADDDIKHARVLRLSAGEHLAVIDAEKNYFECEIISFEEKLTVRISSRFFAIDASFPQIILAQGLAKSDKVEMVIRHATELGVRQFVPFTSERSVVKLDDRRAAKRLERWRTIAKSAAMQSGQPAIPEVKNLCSLADLPNILSEVDALLVFWEEALEENSLKAVLKKIPNCDDSQKKTIALVVGPEGGLSKEEVVYLANSMPHTFVVSLGPSILRTETAGIVAPALVIYELGGFEQNRFCVVAENE